MAQTVKAHVEHLLVAQASGLPVDSHTAHWLGESGPEMRGKLIAAGL